MQRTSDLLVQSCADDLLPDHMAVICDYFGMDNDEHHSLILGLYQGLVNYRGVTSNDLHTALKKKKLNDLIHKHYQQNPTRYYQKFCDLKLVLGTSL